jgi:hypothetical protein
MAEAAARRAIRPIPENVDIDPKMIPQAETRHQRPGAGKGITQGGDGPSDIADARSHKGIRPRCGPLRFTPDSHGIRARAHLIERSSSQNWLPASISLPAAATKQRPPIRAAEIGTRRCMCSPADRPLGRRPLTGATSCGFAAQHAGGGSRPRYPPTWQGQPALRRRKGCRQQGGSSCAWLCPVMSSWPGRRAVSALRTACSSRDDHHLGFVLAWS